MVGVEWGNRRKRWENGIVANQLTGFMVTPNSRQIAAILYL